MTAGEEIAAVIENLPAQYKKVIAGSLVSLVKKHRKLERDLCIRKLNRRTCGNGNCDDEQCAIIRRAAGSLHKKATR